MPRGSISFTSPQKRHAGQLGPADSSGTRFVLKCTEHVVNSPRGVSSILVHVADHQDRLRPQSQSGQGIDTESQRCRARQPNYGPFPFVQRDRRAGFVAFRHGWFMWVNLTIQIDGRLRWNAIPAPQETRALRMAHEVAA